MGCGSSKAANTSVANPQPTPPPPAQTTPAPAPVAQPAKDPEPIEEPTPVEPISQTQTDPEQGERVEDDEERTNDDVMEEEPGVGAGTGGERRPSNVISNDSGMDELDSEENGDSRQRSPRGGESNATIDNSEEPSAPPPPEVQENPEPVQEDDPVPQEGHNTEEGYEPNEATITNTEEGYEAANPEDQETTAFGQNEDEEILIQNDDEAPSIEADKPESDGENAADGWGDEEGGVNENVDLSVQGTAVLSLDEKSTGTEETANEKIEENHVMKAETPETVPNQEVDRSELKSAKRVSSATGAKSSLGRPNSSASIQSQPNISTVPLENSEVAEEPNEKSEDVPVERSASKASISSKNEPMEVATTPVPQETEPVRPSSKMSDKMESRPSSKISQRSLPKMDSKPSSAKSTKSTSSLPKDSSRKSSAASIKVSSRPSSKMSNSSIKNTETSVAQPLSRPPSSSSIKSNKSVKSVKSQKSESEKTPTNSRPSSKAEVIPVAPVEDAKPSSRPSSKQMSRQASKASLKSNSSTFIVPPVPLEDEAVEPSAVIASSRTNSRQSNRLSSATSIQSQKAIAEGIDTSNTNVTNAERSASSLEDMTMLQHVMEATLDTPKSTDEQKDEQPATPSYSNDFSVSEEPPNEGKDENDGDVSENGEEEDPGKLLDTFSTKLLEESMKDAEKELPKEVSENETKEIEPAAITDKPEVSEEITQNENPEKASSELEEHD